MISTRSFMTIAVVAIIFMAGQALFAQSGKADAENEKYITLLRKDLRSDKKQFIALNLPLTADEAARFWPVYEQYATELAKVYDSRIQIVKDYAANYNTLTDASAASLNQRAIGNEAAVTSLRKKYVPLVGKVLPGKKAALFFQIEKRLGLLIDLQLASEIPLVIQ